LNRTNKIPIKKSSFLVCLLIIYLIIGVVACRDFTEEEIKMKNAERWEQLPREVIMEHIAKIRYAEIFMFNNSDQFISYSSRNSLRVLAESGKERIEFIICEQDAQAGDEKAFYLWPQSNSPKILKRLNTFLPVRFNDWDTVPFSHPLTMEDIIEYWEVIWDLLSIYELSGSLIGLGPAISDSYYENVTRRLNAVLPLTFDDWDSVPFSHPISIDDVIRYHEEIWELGITLDIMFTLDMAEPLIEFRGIPLDLGEERWDRVKRVWLSNND